LEAQDGGVVSNLSTAYTSSVETLAGTVVKIYNTEVEKYNGELGGSTIDVVTGELNDENIYKQEIHPKLTFNSTGSSTNIYPVSGEYIWKYVAVGSTFNKTVYVDTLYINEREKDSLNIFRALESLAPGDTIKLPSFRIQNRWSIPSNHHSGTKKLHRNDLRKI